MRINLKLLIFQILAVLALLALALFLPAGTLLWPAGWTFLGLFLSFSIFIFTWLFRNNPGLLQERMHMGTSDQQAWDKVLFPLLQLTLLAWLVFMALDAERFHWSFEPAWLHAAGALILLGSFLLLFLTFKTNTFLSTVIRHQMDRGQSVISSGPYQFVRHPMYAAILLFVLGASLLLDSWHGLLFGLLAVSLLARRSVLEEQMLLSNLPGYVDYRSRVRYRLIPHVW